jgi:uncharacterized protein YeaO (DUF488 family)
MIKLKRAYEPKSMDDGLRILVDHLWPRGVAQEQAGIDQWQKDIAPSTQLRQWFKHDPARWEEFKGRYFKELEGRPEAVARLAARARRGAVTFVYGARDKLHNNAVALKEYIEKHMPA